MAESDSLSSIMLISGIATLILGASTIFLLRSSQSKNSDVRNAAESVQEEEEGEEMLDDSAYPGGYLHVLFGSQTGTANEFGKAMEKEAEECGFKVRLIDLEDVPVDCDEVTPGSSFVKFLMKRARVNEKIKVVLLMATYGEGEPTDNAREFVGYLEKLYARRDEQPEITSCLENVEFSVFGLGNKEYEHFNAMGKLMDNLLPKFGAKRVSPLGLGDDDDDIEGDYQQWKDEIFWPNMKMKYLSSNSPKVNDYPSKEALSLPDCHYAAEFITDMKPNEVKPDSIRPEDVNSFTKHYFTAVDCPVIISRELRSPHDGGSTVHMEIDISKHVSSGSLSYHTADNLAVLPVNDDDDVAMVASALGYDLDAVFRLKPSSKKKNDFKHLFPTPCTVRECLARYCDLTMAPRRSELKVLANYARDPTDKKALLRMASKEGKQEYKEKVVDAHIGILEIITQFCKSIEMPLEHFIDVCPRLLPRYYTISSSSVVHPSSVHITVSVLTQMRKNGTIYKGICSSHLGSIVPGVDSTCRVFCRASTFRLPEDTSKPVIMIGPGTGIAPMRAMLQERSYQRIHLKKHVGETILYFGCKNRAHDYIYSDELEEFQKEGTLTSLNLAFSREKREKVYVQHLLRENAISTWNLIEKQGAYIFVCGGTRMGHDVVVTLQEIFKEVGRKTETESVQYLKQLESDKRLVQELWS